MNEALALLLSARYADVPDLMLEPPVRAWADGFVACAQGRFADAIALAQIPFEDDQMRPHAALTLGSAFRQTRRYTEAEAVEEAALALVADPELAAQLLVSLAADGIGLADLPRCFRRLELAVSLVERPTERLVVRHAWVSTEFALLRDESAPAIASARRAVAHSAGMPRHLAKSHLFLGVALTSEAKASVASKEAADSAGEARRAFEAAIAEAEAIGATPIVEVARAQLRMPL